MYRVSPRFLSTAIRLLLSMVITLSMLPVRPSQTTIAAGLPAATSRSTAEVSPDLPQAEPLAEATGAIDPNVPLVEPSIQAVGVNAFSGPLAGGF